MDFFEFQMKKVKDFKSDRINFSIILIQYANEEAQFSLHLYSSHTPSVMPMDATIVSMDVTFLMD